MLDVVYPYKLQPRTWEMRFSLRSLANLEHRRVFIAGDKPFWAKHVTHIPIPQDNRTKWENSLKNILAACRHPELADDFVLMNDDFFILSKQDRITEYHRGDLDTFIEDFPHRSAYWKLASDTNDLLKRQGIEKRYFFGIHTPTVLNKHKVLELCERFKGERIMLRTLYHNIYGTPAVKRQDVKKRTIADKIEQSDYLSTSDRVGRSSSFYMAMERRFPQACYYERE